MERLSVSSLDIRSIGYDSQSLILEVEFISGDIYQYFNVPEYLYNVLINSSSKGQFLNDNIRFGYRYQKIRDFICWKREIICERGHNEVVPKL